MSTTYVIVKFNALENAYDVGISVQHRGRFKVFEVEIAQASQVVSTNVEIVTSAWTLLKNDISNWIDRVNAGQYLAGSEFVPQEDGTLVIL